jgi:hypothetical protein
MIYLIEYDRASGTIVKLQTFGAGDSTQANTARMTLELDRMRANIAREIVILEADSEEQLHKTHRRYFEQLQTLADPDTSVLALNAT